MGHYPGTRQVAKGEACATYSRRRRGAVWQLLNMRVPNCSSYLTEGEWVRNQRQEGRQGVRTRRTQYRACPLHTARRPSPTHCVGFAAQDLLHRRPLPDCSIPQQKDTSGSLVDPKAISQSIVEASATNGTAIEGSGILVSTDPWLPADTCAPPAPPKKNTPAPISGKLRRHAAACRVQGVF